MEHAVCLLKPDVSTAIDDTCIEYIVHIFQIPEVLL